MYFQLATPTRRTYEFTKEGIERAAYSTDKLNGITGLYRTIYNFEGWPAWDNAVIDKIFVDFDPEKKKPNSQRELFDARRLHEYLTEENVQHSIYFSGRGFHIFIAVNEVRSNELKNPRHAVRNCHQFFKEKAKIHPDPVTTDLRRISRIPNTKNLKTGLFCIPLSGEELYWEIDEIRELARKQRSITNTIKGNKINLDYFDVEMTTVEYREPVDSGVPIDLEDDSIPKCVIDLLSYPDCNYQERYAIITALRDLQYSRKEVKELLKRSLSEKKYKHCVYEERQVDYLFQRQDLLFPSCQTLKSQGICTNGDGSCNGQNVYL